MKTWVLKLKQKFENEDEAYDSCIAEAYVKIVSAVNKERIKSLLKNSAISSESADALAIALKPEDEKWMTVYTLYYDSLRICAEAFLLFDKISSSNHLCLFAALCTQHPELEFDWKFFEKVRTKRNASNYYGEKITYGDWKSSELQMKLYISTLKKEINKKLENNSE